jgi:uncharacterized membrane protein YfcA
LSWLTTSLNNTYTWAKQDYKEWPLRFFLEITAWFMSILCAVWMGMTLPNPPFLILYPLFIIQCGIFAWAAWTRKSTGMVANYLLLVTIDIVAILRLISNT